MRCDNSHCTVIIDRFLRRHTVAQRKMLEKSIAIEHENFPREFYSVVKQCNTLLLMVSWNLQLCDDRPLRTDSKCEGTQGLTVNTYRATDYDYKNECCSFVLLSQSIASPVFL
jgi:hypothetical protein